MNNTFDIQRFGLLLRRKWLEFGKIYLVTLAVAFGVILVSYLIAFWPVLTGISPIGHQNLFFREPLFLIFGFLFLTAVASNYFAHLGQKPKTIIDLLIPASTFEKFLAGVFFTGILTTVSFILIFNFTDLVFVTKFRDFLPVDSTTDGNYFYTRNQSNIYAPMFVVPLFVTSIFLLGSIYFDKFHYIKTALSVMVFCGAWLYIFVQAAEWLTSNKHQIGNGGPFTNKPGDDVILWTITVVLLVLTLAFWSITYVRLKEKEV